MQIVYISNRSNILADTLAYVRAFMGFVDDVVVFSPASEVEAFRRIPGQLRVFEEADLLGAQRELFRRSADHQRKNYILRSQLAYFPEVAAEFLMSDDDSRPLRPIEASYFTSNGKHQPFFFHVLERWAEMLGTKRTSYDLGNLNTLKALKAGGLGTLSFSSHMAQIIDRELLKASVEYFWPALQEYGSIAEWETYFNFAIDRRPERFHPPRPFTVLGWPDKPHWRWLIPPPSFDFENFHPQAYQPGGIFAGLPSQYEPNSHAATTVDKARRYTEYFARRWRHKNAKLKRRSRVRSVFNAHRGVAMISRCAAKLLALGRPPEPPHLEVPALPIEIAGLFRDATGLVDAAAMLARTLGQCAPVGSIKKLDISGSFGSSAKAAADASAPNPKTRTLIVCLTSVRGREYLNALRPSRTRGKRIIGYLWCEFPSLLQNWETWINDFDEIWVSSRYTFDRWKGTLGPHLRWIPLDLRDDGPSPAASGGPIRPLGMVSTFHLASALGQADPAMVTEVLGGVRARLGPCVSLTLQIGGVADHPDRYVDFVKRLGRTQDGFSVVAGDLPDHTIRCLIDRHDVYLSFRRPAGPAMPIAHAMARGKVVVAARSAEILDFVDTESTVLIGSVPGKMQDTKDETHIPFAEFDTADAVARIVELLSNPARMRALGDHARARIAAVSEAALVRVRRDLFP